jgi:translocation and assembly module TamB
VNGPAALSSLSGTIQTSNASLSAPTLRLALTDIAGTVQLGRNRANLNVSANASNGGRLRLGGGVTLTSSLPADISVALDSIVLIDPRLYRTSVSGDLRVAGPLAGGAQITGQVNIGETNVNVPSTGLTSIGEIPQITHIGARPGATTTRRRAGLTGTTSGSDPAAGGSSAGFGLGLLVNAPNRIFVRGRGLDAELGGGLSLTGTTNRVISAGRFELIRGRLDILGKRFTLEEGTIEFQGDLVPYLRFVSATDTAAGEVRVIVEGPADEPVVTFESTPEAPQDEVLSQLLFGRDISEISAFQALQLASAVATLAGRGGGGIISNLREGFGLDDLDVTTTEDGATALRLGKYLTDNVYTDFTASSDGNAEVSLNLDITPNLTGKATLGSDGESSLGVFFEKDY